MAYNEYTKTPLLSLIPRSYLETPPSDPDMPDDTSDSPFVKKFYMAQSTARTELFIPTRYKFGVPDASIGGAVTVSQAASSTQAYTPDVPAEASSYALNDSHVEQDELAVTECDTLTFSVTLNGSSQLTDASGTLGGSSLIQSVAAPAPFHKFSREVREFVSLASATSTFNVTLASGSAGPRTGSWANSAFTWDDNYDYYVYATSSTGTFPSLVGFNCAAYPETNKSFSLSFEIDESDTVAFWNYLDLVNTTGDEDLWDTISGQHTNTNRHYGFYGPLPAGTAGSTIRARMTGSSCNYVSGSFGGGISLTVVRIPKGATVTTYDLATSVSLSVVENTPCDETSPSPATDDNTSTDTVTVATPRNSAVYYYISEYSEDVTWEKYCPFYDPCDAGGSATVALVKSGDDYTLTLTGLSSATRGEAQVTGSAAAVVMVVSYPEGQALVSSPGITYYRA